MKKLVLNLLFLFSCTSELISVPADYYEALYGLLHFVNQQDWNDVVFLQNQAAISRYFFDRYYPSYSQEDRNIVIDEVAEILIQEADEMNFEYSNEEQYDSDESDRSSHEMQLLFEDPVDRDVRRLAHEAKAQSSQVRSQVRRVAITAHEFDQINKKLSNGEALSYQEVKDFVYYVEHNGIYNSFYKRLKYWITNKVAEYSMGNTAIYISPFVIVKNSKEKLTEGKGLTYNQVVQLLEALRDCNIDYSMYQGEIYRDHSGFFNGHTYRNGNIHLDPIVSQKSNFKDVQDVALNICLKVWAHDPENRTKKYYADSCPKEPKAQQATSIPVVDACEICALPYVDNKQKLNCCNQDICKNCFNKVGNCPFCRKKI